MIVNEPSFAHVITEEFFEWENKGQSLHLGMLITEFLYPAGVTFWGAFPIAQLELSRYTLDLAFIDECVFSDDWTCHE